MGIQQGLALQQGRGEGVGHEDQNLRAKENRDGPYVDGESEEQEKGGGAVGTMEGPEGATAEQAHRETGGEERREPHT